MPPSLAKLELHARSEPADRKPRRSSLLLLALALTTAPIAPTQATVETTPSPATGQPQYTIRARVPLTIVDVVVTDAKGHPVHGLQQSDFTLLENNQPMHPNSFEEHRSDDATPAAPTPLNLPPDTFTNVAPTPPSDARPINLLLLDSLNTPTAAQVHVRQQTLDYLKTMPAATRMAIFGLSTHLFVIQGFTDDPELLRSAITRSEKLMPLFSPLEDVNQDPAQFNQQALEEQGNNMAERGLITFTAIRQIARYLSGIPGRKNLIWSSAAFPLQFPPDPRDPDAWPPDFPPMFDFTQDIKSMGDMLARAHIAVYPIEPRGLDRPLRPGDRKAAVEFGEHSTMDDIADLTGGHNFHNTNGIGEALAAAVDTGANFYTLTYTPTNQTLDTRFRAITVKVDQPNLHLTYRNGYYAIAPEVTLAGKAIEKVTPMQAALMRGSLEPTQILFKVRVTQSPTTDAKLSPDNQPDPKQMKPPYRHYTIAYAIDVHGIDFSPSPDGNYRGGFEYGVRVYNADGDEIVNSVSKTVNPVLPPAVYKSMLSGGANAHQEIDLPATGNYFLRIAVHDLTTDHVGAIEIPSASLTATAGKE